MSVTSLIEFDDAAEHIFDATTLQLANDQGLLKSQVLSSEVLFANYDTDDELTSKRGAKELAFSGVDDTGAVSSGKMTFTTDRSLGTYAGITDVVDDFAVRFDAYSLLAAPPGSAIDIAVLRSNVDNSQITWRYQNQGGGISRIYCKVVDSAGATASDFIAGSITQSIGVRTGLAVSNDDDGNLLMYFDGALVNTIASPTLDFTDCDLEFGNNAVSGAAASIDNVQIFNGHAITEAYTSPFPEPTTYVLTEQVMQTIIPLMIDTPISITAVQEVPSGSQMQHFVYLDGDAYYHNGTAWTLIDLTSTYLSQSNTLAELIANWSTLPIVAGIGKTVKIGHVFKSDSGYATPLLESLTAKYKYTFKAGTVPLCAVYGTVLDNSGCAVSGAKVWVKSDDSLINAALIGPAAYVETNAEGKYSVSVPQGITATFTHEYQDSEPGGASPSTEYVEKKYPDKVIPATATVAFDQLADA